MRIAQLVVVGVAAVELVRGRRAPGDASAARAGYGSSGS